MIVKWDRETILVIIMSFMILIGSFYYGNTYFVEPLKEEAATITQTVQAQQLSLNTYPPTEELHSEYAEQYAETEDYLPQSVEINKEIVELERLAGESDVVIQSIIRNAERQIVEEVSDDFLKDTYSVEMTSDSPVKFRQLLNTLENEERVWNLSVFSYNKSGEESYSGSFNFDLYYLNNEN